MDLFQPEEKSSSANPFGKVSARQPLAARMRPRNLDEFIGQAHLVGKEAMFRRLIEAGALQSVIFYGPPSSGKTTLASVISSHMNAFFATLNAVLDGTKDLRLVIQQAKDRLRINGRATLLFVDEIHRWNRAQQDALLPHVESGTITLIGATTENPFYALVGPLLSRCQLFELEALQVEDVSLAIERTMSDADRGLANAKVTLHEDAQHYLASHCGGDVRHALNALEAAVTVAGQQNSAVDLELAKACMQQRKYSFDRSGDEHYHYASAFIKSMRGSDPDAALYWMSAALESGEDPNFLFRRMLIFCSEDIGLADSNALIFVQSAQEAFQKTGMPEGWYFLAHACLYLSTAPKSNSTSAVFAVRKHLNEHGIGSVPPYLKDKTANAKKNKYTGESNHSEDYHYPHNFPSHWVEQTHLPQSVHERWFSLGGEGREKRLAQYWEYVKVRQESENPK